MVIAYLMQEMDMQMLPAMSFTRQRRPIVYPNPGFQKQLMEFEKQLQGNKRHKSKGGGEKTTAVGSAPTVQTSSYQQNYQNFSDKMNSLHTKSSQNQNQGFLAQSPTKQQKGNNIIDRIYSSPISKNLMHQRGDLQNELKQNYIQQSADKSKNSFQSRLQYDGSQKNNHDTIKNKSQYQQYQDRAHTSQVPYRSKGMMNSENNNNNAEAIIKQELNNRINNTTTNNNNILASSSSSPYSKHQHHNHHQQQQRAKSSYGSKSKSNQNYIVGTQQSSSTYKQRNISEHTLPVYQQNHYADGATQSLDPSTAYYNQQQQQSQSQIVNNFSKSTKQNSTIGQSLYNSISRQRQESQESMTGYSPNDAKFDQTSSLQYYCDHCNVALFTTKDIIEHHNSNTLQNNLTHRSSQLKFNHNQQHQQYSMHQSKQSQQIFGKTFTDMSKSAAYGGGSVSQHHKCGSLFIKRKEWIIEQDGSEGNILCPRKSCAVKIGSYCWQGTRCSTCGQYVSPAFQIFRNRIKYRQAEKGVTTTNNITSTATNTNGIGRSNNNTDNEQHIMRTPNQKSSKNHYQHHQHDNNFTNSLNLSYTAESKKSHTKTRRQNNSNIEDLQRLKQGYQGTVQNIQKAQMINSFNNNNGNQHHINHDQQVSQTQWKSSNGTNNGGMKTNLNNLYNQLLLEQERKAKQGSGINTVATTGYKKNNYSSPQRSSQQHKK